MTTATNALYIFDCGVRETRMQFYRTFREPKLYRYELGFRGRLLKPLLSPERDHAWGLWIPVHTYIRARPFTPQKTARATHRLGPTSRASNGWST